MSGLAAPRTGLFQRLFRFHVGARSLQSHGVTFKNARPIYDNGPRGWRSTAIYLLIATDLVVTASFCELTWNHWTMRANPPEDASSSNTLQGEPKDASPDSPHYVLRPTWQRASLATYTLLGGVGLAFLLYSRRSGVIRRLYIVPNPTPSHSADRLVVIQSPLHSDFVGAVWPLEHAQLLAGNTRQDMKVAIKDRRAEYVLGLDGAEVLGEKRPVADARKALFVEWYGAKRGTQKLLESTRVGPAQ